MKRLVLLFVLVLGASSVFAQTDLPSECQAFYPEVLLESSILTEKVVDDLQKSLDYGQIKQPRNKRFWVVYSDRCDNVTYTSPNGSTPYQKLDFNEKVYIAKIVNGWALVYTEPKGGIPYPTISGEATSRGWISMKNLLLWRTAIASQNEIYYKALLCVNLDESSKTATTGRKYLNPNKKTSAPIESSMGFYFVMKREGNLVLLATTHTMDGKVDNVLDGWYSKDSYVEWNQRSCIEPTWIKEDVEYFADEQRYADVYPSLKEAQGYSTDPVYRVSFKRKPQAVRSNPTLYRQNGSILRFPILDGSTTEFYNCSTFGTAEGSVQQAEVIVKESGSALEKKEQVINEMSNINIGIVIDGTQSMDKFYVPVIDALKRSIYYFEKNNYNVRIGVVIYRDYGDHPYDTEVFPLTTPKNENLYRFLETGGDYGVRSGMADLTHEEALYLGVNTAIDRLGFRKEHSNILLVIGDCGNDVKDTRYSSEEIIDKIVYNNINLIGFQVDYDFKHAGACSLFKEQITEILHESLKRRMHNLNETLDSSIVDLVEGEHGLVLKNKDISDIFVGAFYFPFIQGQPMPTSELTDLVDQSIGKLKAAVDEQKRAINLTYASAFKGESFSTIKESFVRQKLSDEVFEAVKEAGSLMAFKGYTPKYDKSKRAFYKPVIFISYDELKSMLMLLHDVYDASTQLLANEYADRTPYINAMKALVQIMIPDDMSYEQMNNMSYDEIMRRVVGLNESANALKGYTLGQLASPDEVEYVEFAKLIKTFKTKYEVLRRLLDNPYEFVYEQSGGVKYYWLPIEDLP